MEKEFGSGKIVLGMSGGVDSSVAYAVLRQTMKTCAGWRIGKEYRIIP